MDKAIAETLLIEARLSCEFIDMPNKDTRDIKDIDQEQCIIRILDVLDWLVTQQETK